MLCPVGVGEHRENQEIEFAAEDFFSCLTEITWNRARKGEGEALWETARAETTSGNVRRAARKPSVSRSPRREPRRRRKSNVSIPGTRNVGIRCLSLASAQSAWLNATKLSRLRLLRKFGDAARAKSANTQIGIKTRSARWIGGAVGQQRSFDSNRPGAIA